MSGEHLAIAIKDAPAPGWYFPVEQDSCPYLWTGEARFQGRQVQGRIIGIFKQSFGPQVVALWEKSRKVVDFGDATRYRLVETVPDTWRGQNITDACRTAEAQRLSS